MHARVGDTVRWIDVDGLTAIGIVRKVRSGVGLLWEGSTEDALTVDTGRNNRTVINRTRIAAIIHAPRRKPRDGAKFKNHMLAVVYGRMDDFERTWLLEEAKRRGQLPEELVATIYAAHRDTLEILWTREVTATYGV